MFTALCFISSGIGKFLAAWRTLGFFAFLILYSNSSINPCIYFTLNDKYRQGLLTILKAFHFVRKKAAKSTESFVLVPLKSSSASSRLSSQSSYGFWGKLESLKNYCIRWWVYGLTFFMEEGGKINRNFGISAAKILFNLQRAEQSVFLCSKACNISSVFLLCIKHEIFYCIVLN